jgi:hypothetical protein
MPTIGSRLCRRRPRSRPTVAPVLWSPARSARSREPELVLPDGRNWPRPTRGAKRESGTDSDRAAALPRSPQHRAPNSRRRPPPWPPSSNADGAARRLSHRRTGNRAVNWQIASQTIHRELHSPKLPSSQDRPVVQRDYSATVTVNVTVPLADVIYLAASSAPGLKIAFRKQRTLKGDALSCLVAQSAP